MKEPARRAEPVRPTVPPLPEPTVPGSDREYFEILTRFVFKAGFRWDIVDQRWPAIVDAFEGLRPELVRDYGEIDVARLMSADGMVRNHRKVRATIANATAACRLIDAHGSIAEWLAASAELPIEERLDAVAAPFKGLGPIGAHFFLWSVGEQVPPPGVAGRPAAG